jgi:hypothetical protein
MAKPRGSQKTGGRQKGTPNKVTADLRTAILGALEAKGGQQYLEDVAANDPRTFCALLGKVLPMQIQGDEDKPLFRIERVIVVPKPDDRGEPA